MEPIVQSKKIREFKLKTPLRKLSKSYSLLLEFSQIIDDFDEKRDLEYFSGFYNEIMPVVNTIVIYIVDNKLAGISKTIDEYVFGSQKIVELLKVLHSRFSLISDHSMEKKPSHWYSYSQKESGDILNDIRLTLNEVLALKDQHLSY